MPSVIDAGRTGLGLGLLGDPVLLLGRHDLDDLRRAGDLDHLDDLCCLLLGDRRPAGGARRGRVRRVVGSVLAGGAGCGHGMSLGDEPRARLPV
jgi:hypothetical protein